MLLSWLLTCTLILLVSVAVIILIAELYGIWKMNFYTAQGFKPVVFPFMGGFTYLLTKKGKTNSMMESIHATLMEAKAEGKPGIVCNGPTGGTPLVLFSDMALTKEYFIKEVDVSARIPIGDHKFDLGFFFISGEKGVALRKIYSDYFGVKRVSAAFKTMRSIVKANFDQIKSVDSVSPSQTSRLVNKTLIDIVSFQMLGDKGEIDLNYEGKSFSELLTETAIIIFSDKVFYNPINGLLQDLPNKFNLLSGSREASRKAKVVESIMMDYLKEKEKTYKLEEGKEIPSWIDISFAYNLKAKPEDRLPLKTVIGNCNGLFTAGLETTRNLVEAAIFYLSHRPELQERLRKEIKDLGLDKDDVTYEQVEKSLLFDTFIKESLRVCPPAPFSVNRAIIKDFTLGNYRFRKGDNVRVPYGPLMWDSEFFKSETKFNMDSITSDNKSHLCPFSFGKRSCFGQLYAMIEAKMITIEILSRYNIKAARSEDDPKFAVFFAMKIDRPDVILEKL